MWINLEPGTPEEQHSINEYAFLARLAAAGVNDDIKEAVSTLQAILENGADYEDNDPLYNGRIAEATMWNIYSGHWLIKEVVRSPIAADTSTLGAFSPGTMYNGPILGLERWRFWKKALEVARESSRLNDETRSLTKKAVDLMNALELLNS